MCAKELPVYDFYSLFFIFQIHSFNMESAISFGKCYISLCLEKLLVKYYRVFNFLSVATSRYYSQMPLERINFSDLPVSFTFKIIWI